MILDTDVLIWYMRGNKKAFNLIENHENFSVSVVTYIELVQGMRNKNELTELRKAFRGWKTEILYINEEISAKAMFYVERHYLAHTMQQADALIAATAVSTGLPLITGNDKHYNVIKELEIKRFKP